MCGELTLSSKSRKHSGIRNRTGVVTSYRTSKHSSHGSVKNVKVAFRGLPCRGGNEGEHHRHSRPGGTHGNRHESSNDKGQGGEHANVEVVALNSTGKETITANLSHDASNSPGKNKHENSREEVDETLEKSLERLNRAEERARVVHIEVGLLFAILGTDALSLEVTGKLLGARGRQEVNKGLLVGDNDAAVLNELSHVENHGAYSSTGGTNKKSGVGVRVLNDVKKASTLIRTGATSGNENPEDEKNEDGHRDKHVVSTNRGSRAHGNNRLKTVSTLESTITTIGATSDKDLALSNKHRTEVTLHKCHTDLENNQENRVVAVSDSLQEDSVGASWEAIRGNTAVVSNDVV
mmetsp:Transcript_12454/g.21402  ORF Transcript_12454/g.21402 Transcript_12454/m.21402 type:complete len:351 (+) Transcript_12454:772-1824(+)